MFSVCAHNTMNWLVFLKTNPTRLQRGAGEDFKPVCGLVLWIFTFRLQPVIITMLSGVFCPQPKDLLFTVIKEERNRKCSPIR